MLFAEISDAVWLAVVGIVAMVVKEHFDSRRARIAEVIRKAQGDKLAMVAKAASMIHSKVEAVETMVNGQRTAMQERIDGLENLIKESMASSKPVPVEAAVAIDKAVAKTVATAVEKARNGCK